ncbi:MAG: hypothetical protein HZB40_16215 [Rhodocyclales bacterium]|nr:hypothetical protein [Rhodocyclales bacterium]
MKAVPILDDRYPQGDRAFVAIRVFKLAESLRGSRHKLKYRLAYVVNGVCVLRFDNEIGKGDHIHRNGKEAPYSFVSLEKLLADFWSAVDSWRP